MNVTFFTAVCTALFVNYAAAQDERSLAHIPLSAKRSAPSGEREPERPAKRPEAIGRWMRIRRQVPGGRGLSAEKINLLSYDHLTKKTFHEHIAEDHNRGLPWIIGLILYKQVSEDGSVHILRDYVDGRSWHRYLITPNNDGSYPQTHPLYNGTLKGFPEYYQIEVVKRKFVKTFLACGNEVHGSTVKGKLLRLLLDIEQNSATWDAIGSCYRRLNMFEESEKWHRMAMGARRSEGGFCGKILMHIGHIYLLKREWDKAADRFEEAASLAEQEDSGEAGDILQEIGHLYRRECSDQEKELAWFLRAVEAYKSKENPGHGYVHTMESIGYIYELKADSENAILWFKRALEANDDVRIDNEMHHVMVSLGFQYEIIGNYMDACLYYMQALENRFGREDAYALAHMLYLHAAHPEACEIATENMHYYASRFNHMLENDQDLESYENDFKERFDIAEREANRILGFVSPSPVMSENYSSTDPDEDE